MSAADKYTAIIDAVNDQRARINGLPGDEDDWGGQTARRFRLDPQREQDPALLTIASYLEPQDVLIDAGGGAGRVCLPLASRCRQVINVDPSPGMGAEFEASAAEAGISNARFVQSDWLEADGVQGDVTLTCNVTYFVRDIVAFIDNLESSASRRVIIIVSSVPNPNHNAKLFRLVYEEEQNPVPGHPELMAVLWEMGILPDLRMLPGTPKIPGCVLVTALPQTREEALTLATLGQWLAPKDHDRARSLVQAQFDELFQSTAEGFLPVWLPDSRQLAITWETGGPRSK